MAVRFKPDVNLSQALQKTGEVFRKANPGVPFEYKFADQDFETLFSSETLIGKLAGLFAMLAIFISCLGLFGLAAFTAERRTKEIGIRKVPGRIGRNTYWSACGRIFKVGYRVLPYRFSAGMVVHAQLA